ncbi:hypothetical protein OIU74_008911 [Salix koriyanagi]|uniref:Uncharacterized protein n=1 Tax=Salix koriyanagi TaxID=2511006 RepID=A0A9Q0Z065_9ROSI|nr:hypothetical protein OIU74_008911 [Salix koriyanagi]
MGKAVGIFSFEGTLGKTLETMEENEWDQIEKIDAFWEKLRLAAEKKVWLVACHSSYWPWMNHEAFLWVGAAEAVRFSKAFNEVHRKLDYEELSLDAHLSLSPLKSLLLCNQLQPLFILLYLISHFILLLLKTSATLSSCTGNFAFTFEVEYW